MTDRKPLNLTHIGIWRWCLCAESRSSAWLLMAVLGILVLAGCAGELGSIKKLTKERIDTQRRETQGNPEERFRVLEREFRDNGRTLAVTLQLETRDVWREKKRYQYQDAFETYWGHWFTESTRHGPWEPATNRTLSLDSVRRLEVAPAEPRTDDQGQVTLTLTPEATYGLLEPAREARVGLDVPSHWWTEFDEHWHSDRGGVELESDATHWVARMRIFDLRWVLIELAEQFSRERLTQVRVVPRALRSQYPLDEARVTVSGEIPTADELLEPHIEHAPWRRYAARELRGYPGPAGRTRSSYDGAAAFRLLLPATYQIKVVEEHHHAAERSMELREGARRVVVDMARLEDSRKLEVDVDY